MPSSNIYRFGEFELSVRARTLSREGVGIALPSKTFEVLLYLVSNSGRVVTKDELLKGVWPDSFVEESNLTQHVFRLRKALQPAPYSAPYIVTIPGQGYQFSAVVESVVAESASLAPIPSTSIDAPGEIVVKTIRERSTYKAEEIVQRPTTQVMAPPRPGWRTVSSVSTIALAALGIWGWSASHHPNRLPVGMAARRSIGVLGFRNLSGRPEEGWLSTALAEMLTTELVAGEKLRLVSGEDIARTKIDLHLADADSLSRSTLARLHKYLNSDLIVLGSYTALNAESDTRIRLDVRLQDTVAGETIADVAVVGSEAALFDLVSQAGSQLREKLGLEAISPPEAVSVRASLPSNREAARLYSEGLVRLRLFDALAARDLLRAAIDADPKYSLAHSALAEAWARLGYDKTAQEEARQAYELANDLSREEKLIVEGRYRQIDHQYDKAIEIYRTLFALFADNVDYGLRLTTAQVLSGKGHDALATVEALRKLAPPASQDPRIEVQEATAWEALGDYKHQEQPLARAVEKARTQGARLILADALDHQCWLFNHAAQPQNAVATCRESGDIYAAAGDRYGEANALLDWATAIDQTNAPESIALFQRAQTIASQVGSESEEARALTNLGVVYATLGDLVLAEKMYRRALPIYRRIDDKRNQARVIGNIANDRENQGDLKGAARLYQETLQLAREAADTGIAALAIDNLAAVYEAQGDLASAKLGFKQSIEILQKAGNWDSSAYAMLSLGALLFQEADFSGARKMYEGALAIRTSAGDVLTVGEAQLSLADLSLEEAHSAVEQEAVMRRALSIFQQQKARDDEIQAWCLLARALLAEKKQPAAKEAMQHARSLAAKSQSPEIRWQTTITATRIETARPDIAQDASVLAARKELNAIIAKSQELGYQGIVLDARLALAEVEMKVGQTAVGRAHLDAIAADAKAKGYKLLARKAAIAHG